MFQYHKYPRDHHTFKKTRSTSHWRKTTHFEPFKIFDFKEKHRIVHLILRHPRTERDEIEARRSVLDDVSTHECHGTLGESLFENRPFRNRPFVDDEVASADKRGENWLTDKPDGGETLIDSYWLATWIGGDAVFAHFISHFPSAWIHRWMHWNMCISYFWKNAAAFSNRARLRHEWNMAVAK